MVCINRFAVGLLSLALVSGTMATVWLVPERQNTIQDMIDDTMVVNGDTVSVWVHTVPPDTYRENINFDGKSITIVNRSFLSGGGTGYDSSWDHVVIDGSNQDSSVVRMTGSLSPVPRVVLKGFTITGGGGAYGGGIYCQDVVAVLEKNYVHNCFAETSGGGICYRQRNTPLFGADFGDTVLNSFLADFGDTVLNSFLLLTPKSVL